MTQLLISIPLSHVTSQDSGAQASLHLPHVYFLENAGNPNSILVWFVGSPKFMCWRPVVSASGLVSGKFRDQIMEALTSLLTSLSRESDSLPWSRGVLQRVLMLWKGSHQLPDCGLQNGETCISFLYNLASLGYSAFWSTEPHAKAPLSVSKLGPWLENHRNGFLTWTKVAHFQQVTGRVLHSKQEKDVGRDRVHIWATCPM